MRKLSTFGKKYSNSERYNFKLFESSINKTRLSEVIAVILIIPLIICISLLVINTFHLKTVATVFLVLSPFFILLAMNYKVMYGILIASLFFPMVVEFYASVFFSYLLLASFILTHRGIKISEFSNPMNIPFIVYLISIISSYIFSQRWDMSLYLSFNLIAFFTIFYSTLIFVNNYSRLKSYIYLFLFLSVINGLSILVGGLAGKRSFGFAGVMFVDYAGIGLSQLIVLALLADKKKKLLLVPIIFILGIALILTQTRGVWLVTAICISFLFIFVFFHYKKFAIKRTHIILVFSFLVLAFAVSSIYTFSINKSLSSRKITDTQENIQNVDVQSSMITRLLIWDTALNAFIKYPITGTGIYTFPFVSQNYYKFPTLLYNRYVKRLTPHETFFAMLTETGVIGFAGFLYLIFNMIRLNNRNLKFALTMEQKKYSLLIMFSSVYIILSMIITDAWLWGHGLVLWSIILGFSAATNRIISKQNTLINQN
jgi:O-antigen ligase